MHITPLLISHWFSDIKKDFSKGKSSSILSKATSNNNHHTVAKPNICSYLSDEIAKIFLSIPHQPCMCRNIQIFSQQLLRYQWAWYQKLP
jgi:hypothetical protein